MNLKPFYVASALTGAMLTGSLIGKAINDLPEQFHIPPHIQQPANTIAFTPVATSTAQVFVPQHKLFMFEPDYIGQGTCIAVRDVDGQGLTYITTSKGTIVSSVVSCE